MSLVRAGVVGPISRRSPDRPFDPGKPGFPTHGAKSQPKQRTKIFGQYDHVRVYGLDYFKRLESCGFKVEKVDFTKTLSKQEISKYCLNEGEIIPVVYKPN